VKFFSIPNLAQLKHETRVCKSNSEHRDGNLIGIRLKANNNDIGGVGNTTGIFAGGH
jgi:hypothetical protein